MPRSHLETATWASVCLVAAVPNAYKSPKIAAKATDDALYCWRAADGKEMCKKRFSKKKHGQSVSPVLAAIRMKNSYSIQLQSRSLARQHLRHLTDSLRSCSNQRQPRSSFAATSSKLPCSFDFLGGLDWFQFSN